MNYEIVLTLRPSSNGYQTFDGRDLRRFVQGVEDAAKQLNERNVESFGGMNTVEALFSQLHRYLAQLKAIPRNSLATWINNAKSLLANAESESAQLLMTKAEEAIRHGNFILSNAEAVKYPDFNFPASKQTAEVAKQRGALLRSVVKNILNETSLLLRKAESGSRNSHSNLIYLAEDENLFELGRFDFADPTSFDQIFEEVQALEQKAKDSQSEVSDLEENLAVINLHVEEIGRNVETFESEISSIFRNLEKETSAAQFIQWYAEINDHRQAISDRLLKLRNEFTLLSSQASQLLGSAIDSLALRFEYQTKQVTETIEKYILLNMHYKETKDEL